MYCISIISTKGGTGKTTLSANLGALMADCGYRILLIDADVQPSLSKYYPIHRYGDYGLTELLLNEQIDERIFSQTVYPNLDIVQSNNITSEIQLHLQSRVDRATLLRARMDLPLLCDNYDVVIIDTQGGTHLHLPVRIRGSHMSCRLPCPKHIGSCRKNPRPFH